MRPSNATADTPIAAETTSSGFRSMLRIAATSGAVFSVARGERHNAMRKATNTSAKTIVHTASMRIHRS
jgi:hypothetical protein